jgi:hypothetical protein
MITYERSALNEQRKAYWVRRSSSNDLSRGDGFPWQSCHGIRPGNQSLTLLEFFGGLRGSLFVTFEEGTWAAWLPALARQRHQATIVRLTLARKIAAITPDTVEEGRRLRHQ